MSWPITTAGRPGTSRWPRSCVTLAGRRWTTEENFQVGKGLAGLDEHQVRTWTAWHRWVTLAMVALAFLTIAAATEHELQPWRKPG